MEKTYTFDRAGLHAVRRRFLIRAVVGGFLGASAYVLIDWPSGSGRESVLRAVVSGIFYASAMSLFFGFLTWGALANYRLTVTEEKMTLALPFLYFRCPTVLRGNVQTIIERKKGITISRWGEVGAHFFSGIWVPKELPAYEEIRSLAVSWKTQAAHLSQ